MAKYLIKNGTVWDGERFLAADVLTENDRVVAIQPNITEKVNYTFDAAGCIVSAGLVDAHVHVAGLEWDGYGINAEMCAIPFGVTAVADAGGAYANGEVAASWLVKNVTLPTADIVDDKADFSTTERKMELYGDQVAGIKVYFDTREEGGVRSVAPLKEICAYARARSLPVMVHCTESPTAIAEIVDVLASGDILTHAFHGGAHTAAEDDYACLREAKTRGVIIDSGFAASAHTNFAVLRGAIANGLAPDTISTDITRGSAYRAGGRYGLTMCMSMARTAGMDEEAIFRAVTSTPAKALGKAGEWGSLKENSCADLAVLRYQNEPYSLKDADGNILSDDMGYRCILTMCNGVIVYRD